MTNNLNRISDDIAVQALQILCNYCFQQEDCESCPLLMWDDTCLFKKELPERFKQWKKENDVEVVGVKVKRRK